MPGFVARVDAAPITVVVIDDDDDVNALAMGPPTTAPTARKTNRPRIVCITIAFLELVL